MAQLTPTTVFVCDDNNFSSLHYRQVTDHYLFSKEELVKLLEDAFLAGENFDCYLSEATLVRHKNKSEYINSLFNQNTNEK